MKKRVLPGQGLSRSEVDWRANEGLNYCWIWAYISN